MSSVRVNVTGSRLYIRFGSDYRHIQEDSDDEEEDEVDEGGFDFDNCNRTIKNDNRGEHDTCTESELDNDEDEEETENVFHSVWLWFNDPINNIHASSGQRNQSCVYASLWKIQSAGIVEDVDVEQYTNLPPPPPIGSLHPVGGIYDDSSNNISLTKKSNQTSSDHDCLYFRSRRFLLHVVWGKHVNNIEPSIRAENDVISPTDPNKNQELTTMETYFDLDWLWQNRYDSRTTQYHEQQTRIGVQCRHIKNRTTQTNEKRTNGNKPKKKLKMKPTVRILTCRSQLERFQYEDVFVDNHNGNTSTRYNDNVRYRILDAIIRDGAVIVEHTPSPSSHETTPTACRNELQLPVAQIGLALGGGRLSHGNLYGDVFHVVSGGINTTGSTSSDNNDEGNNRTSSSLAISTGSSTNNIAFTSQALVPHQDLAYYESIPGLQLLHCVTTNEQTIVGGESILIDVIAAAEHYRSIVPPALFDPLVHCDATFIKQRMGADMVYRRPHIRLQQQQPSPPKMGTSLDGSTNATLSSQRTTTTPSPVVSVRWSPPFEGPLFLGTSSDTKTNNDNDKCYEKGEVDDDDDVDRYYAAYAAFTLMVDNSASRTEKMLRLQIPEERRQSEESDTDPLEETSNQDRGDNNNNNNNNNNRNESNLQQELVKYANHHTWEYKLRSGEILIFNNQRMLHGRRSFAICKDDENTNNNSNNHNNSDNTTTTNCKSVGRHLMGCYTNMDDTINEYRLLRRARFNNNNGSISNMDRSNTFVGNYQPNPKIPPIPVVGNHSSGTY